jgi:hypothetical protein
MPMPRMLMPMPIPMPSEGPCQEVAPVRWLLLPSQEFVVELVFVAILGSEKKASRRLKQASQQPTSKDELPDDGYPDHRK